MRTIKIRSADNWIIPNTYIRVGGAWVLSNNYVRYLADWGNELVIYITATTTNVNLQSLFQATYPGSWAQTVPKRVVINSGVIVGATDTSNYALNIPSGFGGTVKVDNNGSIQGAGGASNGGNGGPAILAGASGVTINNLGTIYAGGGGGGQGGTGGTGSYSATVTVTRYSRSVAPRYFYRFETVSCNSGFNSSNSSWSWNYTFPYPSGSPTPPYAIVSLQENVPSSGGGCSYVTYWYSISGPETQTTQSAGGAGGAGGVGQGYNQAAANGVGGSAGGTNAGTGGTGGAGGAWGTSGNTGGTGANGNNGVGAGGSGGGAAGYYIVNNGNVTWTTTGTRLGSVG